MADRNLKYDYENKNVYDYDSKNKKCEKNCINKDCINYIVVKPIVKIDVNIDGLSSIVNNFKPE